MNVTGRMGLVIAALGVLMVGVRSLQTRQLVGPEIARKLVHVGMGIIVLFLPWIFRDPWPVWILALVAAALLTAVRLVPAIAARFGQVLGGVDRSSLGEIFFPLGVATALTLARGNAAAFCGAVGVLAFADTAGAVVGTRWGRRKYSFAGNHKSIEGSAAVFIVSVISVATAYALLDVKTGPELLRSTLVVGSVATLVEAVSWYGLDNLFLPVVVVALMNHH
jgi:phytol kinase